MYVIILFFLINGLKRLLIKDEKAAGPVEIPYIKCLKQYCCPAITKFLSLCVDLSSGIWLYALFMSATEKIGTLISVSKI